MSHDEFRPLVTLRKAQQRGHTDLLAPQRFETTGLPYLPGNLAGAGWARASRAADPSAGSGEELTGIASGPGVSEGTAQVLTSPVALKEGVIVTYRTDPSWVAVLPFASALLIERGSPLTHVAIAARELGIPTVVQIPGLTAKVKTGTRLRVDGSHGIVQVLSGNGATER